ncbi:hypothetical protein Ancab_007680 [Ancistrocladus abbreviatus]
METKASGKLGASDSYEIEGGETKSKILQNLIALQFSYILYNAVLKNAYNEQEARMLAMDNSSRNVGEMLDHFMLTINKYFFLGTLYVFIFVFDILLFCQAFIVFTASKHTVGDDLYEL